MRIPALNEIKDLAPVEPGEYDLFIRAAKEITNKDKTRSGIMLICDIVGVDSAEPVFETLWFPNSSDDEDKTDMMWRMIKERMVALGLDTTEEHDPSDFVGINFSALLDIDNYNGKVKNIVKTITG